MIRADSTSGRVPTGGRVHDRRVEFITTHGSDESGAGSSAAKSVVQPLATQRKSNSSVASMPPQRDHRVTLALSCGRDAHAHPSHQVVSATRMRPQARGDQAVSRYPHAPAYSATQPPRAHAALTRTVAVPATCTRQPRSGGGSDRSRWPRRRRWSRPRHCRHLGPPCAARVPCAVPPVHHRSRSRWTRTCAKHDRTATIS